MKSVPTTTVTVRVPVALKKRLERLARATTRSRSWLALEALDQYLALNEWQIEAVQEGIADAEAGRLVDHEKMETWVKGWGRKNEPGPPR
jgi:predicted transcriptional regulator